MKNILIAISLIISASSFAQSKIGHVNSQELLDTLESRKQAIKQLDDFKLEGMKELQRLQDEGMKELTETKADLEKAYVIFQQEEKELSPVLLKMAQDKLVEKQQKLENEIVGLQKTRFGVGGEYFQKRQELVKPIQDKVFDAMQKVAAKKNYSFIFDKANQSNLVYATKESDISDDVLEEMGINK